MKQNFLLTSQTDDAIRVHVTALFTSTSTNVIVVATTLSVRNVSGVLSTGCSANACLQHSHRPFGGHNHRVDYSAVQMSRTWRLLVGASRISDGSFVFCRSESFSVDFDEYPVSVHVRCRWRRWTFCAIIISITNMWWLFIIAKHSRPSN